MRKSVMSAADTSVRTSTVCQEKPLLGVVGPLKGELETVGKDGKSTVKFAFVSAPAWL